MWCAVALLRKVLRFLNLLEPRKDGAWILSLSKLMVWVTLWGAYYAIRYAPSDAAEIIAALGAPTIANYGYRRYVQFKTGGVR